MKAREIRDLSPDDIKARIDDTRREIVELRFQMAAHKLESPTRLRLARRNLSRLLTIQSESQRKDQKPAEAKAAPKKAKAKVEEKAPKTKAKKS